MKFLMIAALMSLSVSAFADQCQALDREQAVRAALLIQSGSEIASLCQNCGETVSDAKYSVARNVQVVDSFGSYKELTIAGKGVDLAYTYVKVAVNKYVNVALVIGGCPADGASRMITRQ